MSVIRSCYSHIFIKHFNIVVLEVKKSGILCNFEAIIILQQFQYMQEQLLLLLPFPQQNLFLGFVLSLKQNFTSLTSYSLSVSSSSLVSTMFAFCGRFVGVYVGNFLPIAFLNHKLHKLFC